MRQVILAVLLLLPAVAIFSARAFWFFQPAV